MKGLIILLFSIYLLVDYDDPRIGAGTVRELLRHSSSKLKRLRLQFSSVQFLPSNLLWKVRSVQFKQVPLISEVQCVQFEIHSVQFNVQFRWTTTPS